MAGKFDTMVALLERDSQLAAQFGKTPDTILKKFGVDAAELDNGAKETVEALQRANAVLKSAALGPKDNAVASLKKVSAEAEKAFKKGYGVKVDPIGVVYTEHVGSEEAGGLLHRLTALGTIRCTYGPWDGCHGDVDG
jgi:hypothetical protein